MCFDGFLCIHAKQVAIIKSVIEPAAAEHEQAIRIVDAYEAELAQNLRTIEIGDQMIDLPLVARALQAPRRRSDG